MRSDSLEKQSTSQVNRLSIYQVQKLGSPSGKMMEFQKTKIFSRFYKDIEQTIPLENNTWQEAKKGLSTCY